MSDPIEPAARDLGCENSVDRSEALSASDREGLEEQYELLSQESELLPYARIRLLSKMVLDALAVVQVNEANLREVLLAIGIPPAPGARRESFEFARSEIRAPLSNWLASVVALFDVSVLAAKRIGRRFAAPEMLTLADSLQAFEPMLVTRSLRNAVLHGGLPSISLRSQGFHGQVETLLPARELLRRDDLDTRLREFLAEHGDIGLLDLIERVLPFADLLKPLHPETISLRFPDLLAEFEANERRRSELRRALGADDSGAHRHNGKRWVPISMADIGL